MNIILLGCPGSGKGTQAAQLCRSFGFVHLSTGDIFREEIGRKTPLGKRAAEYVNSGWLVPDAIVMEMVTARLNGEKGQILFDGFPRTLEQAEALDAYLATADRKIDAVVFINVREEEVLRRLTGRRNCSKCGEVYNLSTNPPVKENVCDKCSGALIVRDDDTPATVTKRLMVYRDLTQPLVAYYRANHIFHEVDGARSPEEVAGEITALLETIGSSAVSRDSRNR